MFDDIIWIKDSLVEVAKFIGALLSLASSIISLIVGVLGSLFGTNAYANALFGLLMLGISLVIGIRIWNILADIQILGWKLPKL